MNPLRETVASSPTTERPGAVPGQAEDLRAGLIQTEVSPKVAWLMVGAFLAMLFAVPIAQAILELREGSRPQALELFLQARLPSKRELKLYEDGLQDQARLRRFFQTRVQELTTGWGGVGNSQCLQGRNGWLFYKPGVDYVVGPPFLDPAQLAKRSRNLRDAAGTEQVYADPRPAIIAFKRQLEAAGIQLVLAPIPDKAMLQPAQLSSRWPGAQPVAPPNNPSFQPWLQGLRAAGVDIFDCTPPLLHPGEIRFLERDTHWTPEWMDQVAGDLTAHIRSRLGTAPAVAMPVQTNPIAHTGDLVELLHLPKDQRIFSPQTITIQRVLESGGKPLRPIPTPSPEAEVLLLGDSFSNIFSDEPMGWGGSAGFGEHLALQLQRPVDRLLRNGDGAFASRELLAQELGGGKNWLAGKKVVIWQFAMRELALGNWKPIDLLPHGKKTP